MEYSKSLIESSLRIWDFDMETIDIDKLQHVPMHQFRVTTIDKPLLYIENLQCCVGLYCFGSNYAFASHINTVVLKENEYILDKENQPIYCNRCNDLFDVVIKQEQKNQEPVQVGLSFGCSPLDPNEKTIKLIYEGIDDIIKRLQAFGINAIMIESINAPEFIIDSVNKNIILPQKTKTRKL